MKNMLKFLGIAALTAVIGFSMAACDTAPPDEGEPGLPSGTTFSVKGTFDGKKFSLANTENYSRSAVSAESYAISGELEDGDIIFRLSGTYDPITRDYIASAASSIIRYSISGAFNENGDSLGSTATVLVRANAGTDVWASFSYIVTEEAVTITASQEAVEDTGGIPSWARGWWRFNETFHGYKVDAKLLISQWTIFMESVETDPDGIEEYHSDFATIIEVENKGSYWDLIVGVPFYYGSPAQIEAAATTFLTSKGLTATMVENTDPPKWVYMSNWYYVYEPGAPYDYRFNIAEISFSPDPIPWESTKNYELEQALISYTSDGPKTKVELEAFIAAWLTDKGITATKLPTAPPEMNHGGGDTPDGIYYYYDEDINDINWGIGMEMSISLTPTQWKALNDILMQWYRSNYLEKYLIGLSVPAVTKYAKSRAIFSSNNTRMTLRDYMTGEQFFPIWYWDTVAEAKAASVLYDDPYFEPVTLRR